MDAVADPEVEDIVLVKSVQIGGTEIELNICGYFMDQDPSSVLVILPNDKKAKEWSEERLAPMIRDTAPLAEKVRDPRSGSKGSKSAKRFPGGGLYLVGANLPGDLSSRPIPILVADERDQWELSSGKQGDPWVIAKGRQTTFRGRRKRIQVGTYAKPRGLSPLEKEWGQSDQRHYQIPCPHCGRYQALEFKHLKWHNADPMTAFFACFECGGAIEDHHKPALLEAGRWVATYPHRKYRGYHIWAAYSPWVTFAEIVAGFLLVKDDRRALQGWTNTVLGELWIEDKEAVESTILESRREEYRADVPAGVGVLTGAVDVQARAGGRIEVGIKGWGRGEESWWIHHEVVEGDPTQKRTWDDVDRILNRKWQHESGVILGLSAVAVDSGAYTTSVYKFTKQRQPKRVYAVKGASRPAQPIISRPTDKNKFRAKVFMVGTDTAKDEIYARLKLKDHGPGYIHFPHTNKDPKAIDWCSAEFFRQLTAEQKVIEYKRGFEVATWVQAYGRNEILDLEVYNYAALYMLGMSALKDLGIWVDRLQRKGEAIKAAKATGRPIAKRRLRQLPRQRTGWAATGGPSTW